MTRCRWLQHAVSHTVHCLLVGCVALVVAAAIGMRVGMAAGYPSSTLLLHRSVTAMQQSLHESHGDGVVTARTCCPIRPALARITADCTSRSTSLFLLAAVRGTAAFDTKFIVPVDGHIMIRFAANSLKTWTRSRTTHNTWRAATSHNLRTSDADLADYSCPMLLMMRFTQTFPTYLVNLGPTTVRGVSVWHLRDRMTLPTGVAKSAVAQGDFYLVRPSLFWLRYESLYRRGRFTQHVVVDYSRLNLPVRIAVPAIGSTVP